MLSEINGVENIVSAEVPVVIIGGGLAGLKAGYDLKKKGVLATICTEKIGGRVITYYPGGHELGGQNFYDYGYLPSFFKRLVYELGLKLRENKVKWPNLFYEREKIEDWTELCHFNQKQLIKQLTLLAKEHKSVKEALETIGIKPDTTLYKAIVTLIEGYEGPLEQLDSIETCLEEIVAFLTEKKISLCTIEGGNQLLVNALAKDLNIETGSVLSISKEGDNYLIRVSNGKTFLTKKVVLAIPPPDFKKIDIAPEVLPPDRVKKIEKIKYVFQAKCLIETPKKQEGKIGTHFILKHFHDDKVATLFCINGIGKKSPKEILKKALELFQVQGKLIAFQDYPTGAFIAATTKESLQKLFTPYQNAIFFAGDAVSEEGQGTMIGALETGTKAIRSLLSSYKKDNYRKWTSIFSNLTQKIPIFFWH